MTANASHGDEPRLLEGLLVRVQSGEPFPQVSGLRAWPMRETQSYASVGYAAVWAPAAAAVVGF